MSRSVTPVKPVMESMVKRVANAIEGQSYSATPEEIARVAIVAMREPTEAMLEAGYDSGNIRNAWRAMIYEALT